MDKSIGYELIEELYKEPIKFINKGRSYQLLQEYFKLKYNCSTKWFGLEQPWELE